MAHIVYHRDDTGEIVDESYFCSDDCARTSYYYEGYCGGHELEFCEPCAASDCDEWIAGTKCVPDNRRWDCYSPECAGNKGEPLPCGCVPHRTGTTEWGSFYCYTERQGGYCNFECLCEEDAAYSLAA